MSRESYPGAWETVWAQYKDRKLYSPEEDKLVTLNEVLLKKGYDLNPGGRGQLPTHVFRTTWVSRLRTPTSTTARAANACGQGLITVASLATIAAILSVLLAEPIRRAAAELISALYVLLTEHGSKLLFILLAIPVTAIFTLLLEFLVQPCAFAEAVVKEQVKLDAAGHGDCLEA